jgi:hypothetical protein
MRSAMGRRPRRSQGEPARQAGDEVTIEAVAAVEETDGETAGGDGRGRRQQTASRRLGAPEERDARLEERLQDFGASAGEIGAVR